MNGKNTIVQHTNPDADSTQTYSMIIYVNFHFTEKFVFTMENGNTKQICHLFLQCRLLHNRHSLSRNAGVVMQKFDCMFVHLFKKMYFQYSETVVFVNS